MPSLDQLYECTWNGLNSASLSGDFGSKLLQSGLRRESWLRDQITEDLRANGFPAAEKEDKRRIDISIDSADGRPIAVIESKFLYTHGTSYVCNIWHDFLKRYHYRAPQFEIIFIGNYLSMGPLGIASGLYCAKPIARSIKRNPRVFDSFDATLRSEFAELCEIRSGAGFGPAEFLDASMSLHAMVLLLRPNTSWGQLVEKLRGSTKPHQFEKRMSKLRQFEPI